MSPPSLPLPSSRSLPPPLQTPAAPPHTPFLALTGRGVAQRMSTIVGWPVGDETDRIDVDHTAGAGARTHRQTHRQTDRHTHTHTHRRKSETDRIDVEQTA
eukprot:2182274-Rhodomonas_salina.1